jgi:hypothetical protein
MDTIWDEFARVIYHFELTDEAERQRAEQQMLNGRSSNTQQFNYSSTDAPQYGVGAAVAANAAEAALDGGASAAGEPIPAVVPGAGPMGTRTSSTGSNPNKAAPAGFDPDGNPMSRNQQCWCGSGKKFKNCHGK